MHVALEKNLYYIDHSAKSKMLMVAVLGYVHATYDLVEKGGIVKCFSYYKNKKAFEFSLVANLESLFVDKTITEFYQKYEGEVVLLLMKDGCFSFYDGKTFTTNSTDMKDELLDFSKLLCEEGLQQFYEQ